MKKSNFLRERIDDKIVWRSLKCHYAIEKSVDGIHLNCCDECRYDNQDFIIVIFSMAKFQDSII